MSVENSARELAEAIRLYVAGLEEISGQSVDFPTPTNFAAIPPPPEETLRAFDVSAVPDELTAFHYLLPDQSLALPEGGLIKSWPKLRDLDFLYGSCGTPFHWRHQIPVFSSFDLPHVFTVVCEAPWFGQVWRYSLGEVPDPVVCKASDNLSQLFREWTALIRVGMLEGFGVALRTNESEDKWRETVDAWPTLNILSLPLDLGGFDLDFLRKRQRECGVDIVAAESQEDSWKFWEEVDAIEAEHRAKWPTPANPE